MGKVRRSKLAESDLLEIWVFIAQDSDVAVGFYRPAPQGNEVVRVLSAYQNAEAIPAVDSHRLRC